MDTYWIHPAGQPERVRAFVAPDLHFAFGLARARWPFSTSWTLRGIES